MNDIILQVANYFKVEIESVKSSKRGSVPDSIRLRTLSQEAIKKLSAA